MAVRLPLDMEALIQSRTFFAGLRFWLRRRAHSCDGGVSQIGGVVSTARERSLTDTSTGSTARNERLRLLD